MYKGFVPDSFGYEKVDSFSGSDGQTFIFLRIKSSKGFLGKKKERGEAKRKRNK